MFEPTVLPSEYKRSWNWTWPQIFFVVIILLGAVHIYRVNAVRPATVVGPLPFKSTTGTVVDGPIIVTAGGFLSFKMDFNSRVKLKGWFSTNSKANRLECLVLTQDAFELWKLGKEFQAIAKTGFIPGGRIERVLEPETYYLVFDNRQHGEPEKIFEALFKIE